MASIAKASRAARGDDELAFPLFGIDGPVSHGMWLRDYFAARALPFCCMQHCGVTLSLEDQARLSAEHAYAIAAAMLIARKRP